MNFLPFNSETLRRMADIMQTREQLAAEVATIDKELAEFFTFGYSLIESPDASLPVQAAKTPFAPVFAPVAPVEVETATAAPVPTVAPDRVITGPKRNTHLKESILAQLASAGPSGMRVRDIATAVHYSPANLHVWFATSGKAIPSIVKVGRGCFALRKEEEETLGSHGISSKSAAPMENSNPF